MNKIYVGDTGTLVQVETGQPLQTATVTALVVRKPDGTVVEWAGTAQGSKIVYPSVVSTFDAAGVWRLQARVVMPSGAWLGATAEFKVFAAFK